MGEKVGCSHVCFDWFNRKIWDGGLSKEQIRKDYMKNFNLFLFLSGRTGHINNISCVRNTHANANDKQQRKGRASVFLLDWFFYSFFLLKKYKYFFVNISIFHWGSCMWKREINLIIIYSLSMEICVVVMVSGISEGISFIFLLFFSLILVEMLLFGRLFPNNFGLIGRVYIHVGLVIFKYGVSL